MTLTSYGEVVQSMKTAMTTRVGNARSQFYLHPQTMNLHGFIHPNEDKHLSIRAFLSRDKTLAVPSSMLTIPK